MAERKRETILSHITKKNLEYIAEHLRKYHCLTLQQSSIAVSPIRLIIAYVWLARTGPLKTVHRHSQPRRRKAVLPVGGVYPATVRRAMSTTQKYAAAYESGCGRHIPLTCLPHSIPNIYNGSSHANGRSSTSTPSSYLPKARIYTPPVLWSEPNSTKLMLSRITRGQQATV